MKLPQAFANIGWKFYLVFIILSGLGFFFVWAFLPETKGIPLEEMAKLFGDTDIAVYQEDIHVDHNTHELIVEAHDGSRVQRVVTEGEFPPGTPKIRRSLEGPHENQEKKDSRVVHDERVAEKV